MEDLESLLRKLHHSGEEIFERFCIVNGSFFPLDAIEGMGIEEYSQRTLYSFPQRFYKFFPDTESAENYTERSGQKENYSIKALESNEVYLSNPIDFDDVFDSEINVPFDEFEEFRIRTYAQWSHCQITPDMSAGEVRNAFSRRLSEVIMNKESIDAMFDLKSKGELARLQAEHFALLVQDELLKDGASGVLERVLYREYDEFVNGIRGAFFVACFTTDPMSQLMWGGAYANQHKGFCLEYTVSSDEDYTEILYNIKPVIYTKKRRSVTQALLDAHDNNWDDQALRDLYLGGVLRKSVDWAYQNEWRLLLPRQRGQKGYSKRFFPITKVFLGNRMRPERRREIIEICKRKRIPYVGVTRSSDVYAMRECDVLCEDCPRMGMPAGMKV